MNELRQFLNKILAWLKKIKNVLYTWHPHMQILYYSINQKNYNWFQIIWKNYNFIDKYDR